jgi:hypothetical protein
MTNPNPQKNVFQPILIIMAGLLLASMRFLNPTGNWETMDSVKVIIGVLGVVYGVFRLIQYKKKS